MRTTWLPDGSQFFFHPLLLQLPSTYQSGNFFIPVDRLSLEADVGRVRTMFPYIDNTQESNASIGIKQEKQKLSH